MPNTVTSISNLFADTSIQDATLLDIPFIFDLIVRGSMDGPFTGSFISSSGYIAILFSLFASVRLFSKLQILRQRHKKPAERIYNELLVFTQQGQSIGFLQIKTSQDKNGGILKLIDTCAIKYEFRGRGHGKNMINLFVAMQSPDTKLYAYCNKFAKSMQHIFRRMHFHRTSVGKGLNLYMLDRTCEKQSDSIAECHHH